ncbi:hypothetical protein GCM10025876_14770 [Demequina litorisediminis]|uniref:Uncharacterized protein n=1 Tax=Demequina litorisediminis TaxID=1849022 RepID=A0ABQ6IBQ3_9MICO|nr:hypothetical protein GCM10025876_14770 [Demequina litorisediminis]
MPAKTPDAVSWGLSLRPVTTSPDPTLNQIRGDAPGGGVAAGASRGVSRADPVQSEGVCGAFPRQRSANWRGATGPAVRASDL